LSNAEPGNTDRPGLRAVNESGNAMTPRKCTGLAVLAVVGLLLLPQADAQPTQTTSPPAPQAAEPAPPPAPETLPEQQAQPPAAESLPGQDTQPPANPAPIPDLPPPGEVQQAPPPPPAEQQPAQRAQPQKPDLGLRVELEPKAIALLKAMSEKLASAKTLSFTAISFYESPARTGLPLVYTTLSEVTLQRPNKLRVITPADGPPSEFFYDGKTMTAYSPDKHLVAVADAPPTIDAMLKAAYDQAAIYFPFTDVIVADPYKDFSEGLKLAFVVGQSKVVAGTTTDIVVVASDAVQAQIWIGAEDKLPRAIRATFFDEPGTFRHAVEFTKWRLNGPVPPGTFSSAAAAKAPHMQFARPDAEPPKHP
jgi:hypothetical protein